MDWAPDQAVVLSLPRRTDRRQHMNAMIPRLGFPAQIVDAIDGATATIPASWESSPAAWGNAQSHRKVLKAATGDSILVLEDDAFVPGDFRARLETVLVAAPDWEVIILGGEHVVPPAVHAPGVYRCGGTIRSIGYLMRGRAIPMTVQAINRSKRHWDNEWIITLQALRTYAPNPFVITPTGSASDIPDSTPYR